MKACIVAVVVAVCVSLCCSPVTAASNFTDVDVLNFALNLECLEAEFYSWVAYGEGIASINSTLVGNSSAGLTTSNSGATARAANAFSPTTIAIATEIAENEIAHVRYLRAAITAAGGTADNCPQLSLSPQTFTTAAGAALTAAGITLTPSDQTFNPYSNDAAFLIGAFIFEDVGVTAYKGAVQVLQSSTYATVAAGIGAVEAGHAAIIRSLLYPLRTESTGLTSQDSSAGTTNVTVLQAVNAITALRDSLGGTTSSSVENALTRTTSSFTGVTGGDDAPDLFAADPTTSVAFTRIPKQVLNIVYFSPATVAGGFFPNGISGNNHIINATGTPTTDACSGALSMASLSAVVPLLLTGVAVLCSLMW